MKEDLKSAGKYLVLDLPYTHTTRHFQSLNCVALFIVKKIKSTVCFISFPMLVCESNEIKKYDYSLENIKYFINIDSLKPHGDPIRKIIFVLPIL